MFSDLVMNRKEKGREKVKKKFAKINQETNQQVFPFIKKEKEKGGGKFSKSLRLCFFYIHESN